VSRENRYRSFGWVQQWIELMRATLQHDNAAAALYSDKEAE
jgi:hypothetical protein